MMSCPCYDEITDDDIDIWESSSDDDTDEPDDLSEWEK